MTQEEPKPRKQTRRFVGFIIGLVSVVLIPPLFLLSIFALSMVTEVLLFTVLPNVIALAVAALAWGMLWLIRAPSDRRFHLAVVVWALSLLLILGLHVYQAHAAGGFWKTLRAGANSQWLYEGGN